jgi:hypothetical protein
MNATTKRPKRMSLSHAYFFSVALLIGYIAIYQLAPFAEPWDTIILNIVTALAAGFAAVVATLNLSYYEKDEVPHKVWKSLMIACWLWFAGEVFWGLYVLILGEALVGIFDVCWTVGFIFFTLALYYQYSIVAPSKKVFHRNVAIGAWIVVLLLPFPIMFFTSNPTFKTYVDIFYSAADLAVGIAGSLLIFTFQGGAMMRPWLGLVVFGVTDFLYAWAEQTGLYAWSVENGNLLSLIVDSSYLAAYLILALGFIAHWTLLRYGIDEIQTRG